MKRSTSRPWKNRRGIIAVLAALLFIVMLGMVAFAVDLGYMTMMQTQLQAAADSAALAAAGSSSLTQTGMTQVAQAFAQYHRVAGRQVVLNTSDVQFGTWDTTALTFTALPTGQLGTAVKVTVHVDDNSGGSAGLFFGKVFGVRSATSHASAVAMVNPRDICFVVDLSSSMRCDSLPGSSHTSLIQALFDDLFGTTNGVSNVTYKSTEKGTSLSTGSGDQTVANMNLVSSKKKYMLPAPNTSDSASKAYWGAYFTYAASNGGKISYNNYVDFLTDNGRDVPIINGTPATYSILSINNPNYLKHSEFDRRRDVLLPAREMPTHAVSRAIIDALQIVANQNSSTSDTNQKDWVSIVTFDRKNTSTDTNNVVILKSLSSNYTDVMNAAAILQCCGGPGSCTDSEGGLICAYNHIKPQSQGGAGREHANKVVVFLTDGQPNLYESADSVISAYETAHSSSNWGSDNSQNAALMQSSIMQGNNWYLYSVGVGYDANQTFLNKMACMGGTAVNGATYATATDANTYEATLKSIFNSIVTNPKLRLVQ